MSEIEKKLDELIETLKNSTIYNDYIEAKEIIDANEEKKRAANTYRSMLYQFQSADTGDVFAEVRNLSQMRQEIGKDTEIEAYLVSELALCRLVQKLNYELIEGLGFELGF